MSKKSNKKSKKRRKGPAKKAVKLPEKSGNNRSVLIKIGSGLIILIAVYLLFVTIDREKTPPGPARDVANQSINNSAESQLTKDGELVFISKSDLKTIKTIDIEIVDNDWERTQGLMYRTILPDTAGMLFIFEISEQRSFWMKNTYIPLDIIYVDENKQIVTIQRHTKPLSEDSILSYKSAMYVVEVNAGFCDKYDVEENDLISFLRNNE